MGTYYKVSTSHADFEKLFGGSAIIIEHTEGCCKVSQAENPAIEGELIEISDSGPVADQLAAMYSADVCEMFHCDNCGEFYPAKLRVCRCDYQSDADFFGDENE